MSPSLTPVVREALAQRASEVPALDVLMLFGSQARNEAHVGSDWDFGYLAPDGVDVAALLGHIVDIVGTDRVDLVDLRRASGLLRFRAAQDGRVLYEAMPGLADEFRLEAARFWCESEPILRRGYVDVLADLKP